MALLARRKRNEFPRLDDLVVLVEHSDGCRNKIGRASLELHPVTVAVIVNAEAEGDFREEPRHRKRRRGKCEIAGDQRANGVDDLLGSLLQRRMTAKDL